MTTRAFHQKGESGCQQLHAECRDLLARVRDELDEAFVPISALKTGCIAFALMFLVVGLWLVPIYFKGSFSPPHLFLAISWGVIPGFLAYISMHNYKMGSEVSNYLYLLLVERRNAYPDLEGLRFVDVPLSLGMLKRQLLKLMDALKADIEKPARNAFQWKEDDAINFFSFQSDSDRIRFL